MYENLEFDLDLKLLFMALYGHVMNMVYTVYVPTKVVALSIMTGTTISLGTWLNENTSYQPEFYLLNNCSTIKILVNLI